jgi:signal transduction histidine kinase
MTPTNHIVIDGHTEIILPNLERKKHKTREIIDVLKDNYSAFVAKREILLIVINDAFEVTYMSHSLCDSLHRPKHTIMQRSVFSMVDTKTNENIKSLVKDLQGNHGKKNTVQDFILYCAYNYENYFDGIVINLSDDKRVGGYLFYLHDVSERRKTENQLKDLSLELDSFVYKASHDLRAPLTSLAGLINITEMDFPPNAKENFNLMKRSVTKLDKFIRQLANYSRNNNTETEFTEIDFCSMVQEIIDNQKHIRGGEKIHFEIIKNFDNALVSDPFRLNVILSNLISNAIKYHQVDQSFSFIKIKLIMVESAISISVHDNGIGIHEKDISSIFEMFKRAVDYSDGSGLGLYIVRKALEKLDGKINVESKLGEYSCFTVTLPILKKQEGEIMRVA